MVYTFRGGIHPGPHSDPGYKAATNTKPIELLPAPDQVILPVSMHIGAPASPCVKVGDIVDMGQTVAEAGGFVSAPVHATVSGKVVAVEPRLHPNVGKVDTIIVNAAECEPYITSDHRLLLERPEEVVGGLKMLVKILGVQTAIIGMEENKADAFPGIEKLIAGDPVLKLYPLKCKYPQGAEKQLINACTGREVPSGKLPADAGCAVFNVDTVGAIYRRFTTGMPVVRRVVTVSGSAIVEPKNLECRIGTQLEKLVDACGGFKEPPNKLLMGGPMMGNAQFSLEAPVFKGTNAFLAFCGDEDKRVEDPSCIRCGRCINACPMHLLPMYMNVYGKLEDFDKSVEVGMLDCIECGSCAYVCPARIPLVQQFRLSKGKIMAKRAADRAAAEAKAKAEQNK